MKIIKLFDEYFSGDLVTTEFFAFKTLQARPLISDTTYLAVPWAYLINQNKLNLINEVKKVSNGFTICQHVNYRIILPLIKRIGINALFTPHANCWDWKVKIRPFPHFAVNGIKPSKSKDILYSFVGLNSTKHLKNDVRRNIFSLNHPSNAFVIERKEWHWARENGWGDLSEISQANQKKEYQRILSKSRFSLCPRGYGVSTIRFWESLQAGAIPILISDKMQLPPEIDWSNSIIRIKENNIQNILKVINGISPKKEREMREECLKIYKNFSGQNFVNTIRNYYNESI